MKLADQIKGGAALRYRGGFGFYAVRDGKQENVDQSEAERMLRAGELRSESGGPDKFGVYHFTIKTRASA